MPKHERICLYVKGRSRKHGIEKMAADWISWWPYYDCRDCFFGYQWGWGPFAKLHNVKTAKHPGNNAQYAPEKIQPPECSLLKGKHLVFLGSSVTYGSAAGGVSFADYIAARNVCSITKEAVSGTTLVQGSDNSYISRLQKMDKNKAQERGSL